MKKWNKRNLYLKTRNWVFSLIDNIIICIENPEGSTKYPLINEFGEDLGHKINVHIQK